MSDERMEILRMVADKVIGVDDAERLLRALDEGERKRSEPGRRPSVAASALDGVSEALGAIGQVVQSTVADAMESVDLEMHVLDTDLEDHGVELDGPEFDLMPGDRLSIRGRLSAGSLTLLPSEGSLCTVEGREDSGLRIRRKDGRVRVQWRCGPLTIRVPPLVEEIDAKVMGGDLTACGVPCELRTHVMGGRVELLGVQESFDCKTMGGDLLVKLAPG